jgi:hypothetical protein
LFAGHQIGIHKFSFCKLFFPLFFFDQDFVPPPLHGRPIMVYNKDARTTTSIHQDTRAPTQVLHKATRIDVYLIGEEEQESRTTTRKHAPRDVLHSTFLFSFLHEEPHTVYC